MIFKSIIYTKPYSIEGFGTYMQEKAQVEIILEEGDTVQSCFIEAERQLDEWHEGRSRSNFKKEEGVEYNSINNGQFILPVTVPKVINLQDEQKEIEIDNATSHEELAKLKEGIQPGSPLMKQYMDKLKQLTNGK